MYRLNTHLVKEQNNCVIDVEGQALTTKINSQPENPFATIVYSMLGHFMLKLVYTSTPKRSSIRTVETNFDSLVLFILAMCQRWQQMNGQKFTRRYFVKINTGIDVTVIPETFYGSEHDESL